MNLVTSLLLLAATLLATPTEASLSVLIQRLTDNMLKITRQSRNLETHLANDMDAGNLSNITELLAQVKPDIATLLQSNNEYLDERTNISSILKFANYLTLMNYAFTKSVNLLLLRARLNKAKYQTRKDAVPYDAPNYLNIMVEGNKLPVELEVLDKVLLQWNDIIVNVTVPYQQTVDLLWESNFSPNFTNQTDEQNFRFMDTRLGIMFSLNYIIPNLCHIERPDFPIYDLSGSFLLNMEIRESSGKSAREMFHSLRVLADQIINNCRVEGCADVKDSARYFKKKTNCRPNRII